MAEHGQQQHGGMAMRGAARPMSMMQGHGSHGDHGDGGDGHSGGGDSGGGGGGMMTHEERMKMLRKHHMHTQWCYWALVMLGVWQLAAPFTLGYLNEDLWVRPSGGRGVWFGDGTHDLLRAQLMVWSDVVSGVLLLVFGWRSLAPNRPVSLWICCFVGIWLSFAPLFFWAPTAASYVNSTIVGMLVIAVSILIPGMPNMIAYMQMGPPRPPGWSYNPSSWAQRWIMIALGFVGFVVSRYLAAFQLGYIDRAWDPFFGNGTELVLNSNMSHMWPISDAALGAVSYTFEFLMGFMGAPSRWRTMPWMVAFFGVLVIPLGLTHILLVISQPVVVGHWCTFCLLAAAIMLPMIPLEVDEVVAMGQHMVQAKRRGDRKGSLWTIFWKGGSSEGCQPDHRSPGVVSFGQHPVKLLRAGFWGMSLPWTLVATTALGVWLMFQPAAFDRTGDAAGVMWTVWGLQASTADVYHLAGALIVTTSVISMGEPVRAGRYLNVLLGLIVAVLPWFAGEAAHVVSGLLGTLAGVAVIGLSLPRGPKRETYGLWDGYVV